MPPSSTFKSNILPIAYLLSLVFIGMIKISCPVGRV
jgi:hypothetical protein